MKLRLPAALLLASLTFAWMWRTVPFPSPYENALVNRVWWDDYRGGTHAAEAFRLIWAWSLYALSFFGLWLPVLSIGQRLRVGPAAKAKRITAGPLPPYPDPATRPEPSVILGEQHLGDKLGPAERPDWYPLIPAEGCGLGFLIMGATGSGKTAGALLPIAEQLFAWHNWDQERRVGGLVLEVKGDLCLQVKSLLERHGRGEDYMELSVDAPWVYNPLASGDPSALAFNLMSQIQMLYGRSTDRFWDSAAEALISFLIVIHRLLYDYVTLFDLYCAAGNPGAITELIAKAEEAIENRAVIIDKMDWLALPKDVHMILDGLRWQDSGEQLRTRVTDGLLKFLADKHVPFEVEEIDGGQRYAERAEKLEGVKRYHERMKKLKPELVAAVAEGLNVSLEVFNLNLDARRIFCPPKEAYDPVANADGKYGRPLPPLRELIETPTVLALRLPPADNESLARIIGTLLKQDWHRAVQLRVPDMARDPNRVRRYLAWIADEYHLLCTVGGAKPVGDEKFLNLSRQSLCIPVVAFQSIASLLDVAPRDAWRTIFQAFGTTIVLRQKDKETARHISEMCGRKTQLKRHYGFTEGGQDARVSFATGRMTSTQSTMNLSRSLNEVRDWHIEARDIMFLPRGCALVLGTTGREALPPTFVYLRPYGNRDRAYFS